MTRSGCSNESKGILYGEEQVKEKYGLAPKQLTDMFALMGEPPITSRGIKA